MSRGKICPSQPGLLCLSLFPRNVGQIQPLSFQRLVSKAQLLTVSNQRKTLRVRLPLRAGGGQILWHAPRPPTGIARRTPAGMFHGAYLWIVPRPSRCCPYANSAVRVCVSNPFRDRRTSTCKAKARLPLQRTGPAQAPARGKLQSACCRHHEPTPPSVPSACKARLPLQRTNPAQAPAAVYEPCGHEPCDLPHRRSGLTQTPVAVPRRKP